MSFADLKTKRQPKDSKSYVSASSGPSALVPTQSSPKAAVRDDVVFVDTEGLYPQLPPSLEIRKTDHSGRGLWARQHFKPGSMIMSIEPHVVVLSNQYLDTHCSSCAKAALTSPFMRCSGCGALRYCDTNCQKMDWSMHKPECGALQRWAETAPSASVGVPNDAVRCLGRILWRMKSKGLSSGWSKELQGMQSHNVSPQHPDSVEAHTHLAHSVVRYLGLATPSDLEVYGITSISDLVNLISRFITNAVALTSPSLTPIGVAVSPLVALTNHSCLPNAVVVFPRNGKTKEKEPIMNIIALHEIMAGEEVLMAYLDTTLPKAQRRKVLTETYNFTCQCPLCSQPATVTDPRESVLCPKSCGGTCPLPNEDNPTSQCSICSAAIPDPHAVIDAVRIGQEALDKATRLQTSDADKATQLATRVIPILVSAGLPPSSYPLLALSKLHQSLAVTALAEGISQARLDECVRIAARHVAGVCAVLEEGHPVRAVALAELGKLLAVDEPVPALPPTPGQTASFPPSGPARLKMACETLVKARSELLIGFGRENEGGEVGRDVRESIVALEKELGVWTSGIRNVLEDMPMRVGGKP